MSGRIRRSATISDVERARNREADLGARIAELERTVIGAGRRPAVDIGAAGANYPAGFSFLNFTAVYEQDGAIGNTGTTPLTLSGGFWTMSVYAVCSVPIAASNLQLAIDGAVVTEDDFSATDDSRIGLTWVHRDAGGDTVQVLFGNGEGADRFIVARLIAVKVSD